jgi:hypothetical protein
MLLEACAKIIVHGAGKRRGAGCGVRGEGRGTNKRKKKKITQRHPDKTRRGKRRTQRGTEKEGVRVGKRRGK